jgi:hypothetical protein
LDFFRDSYLTVVFGLCFCCYLASIIGIFTYVTKQILLPLFFTPSQIAHYRLNQILSSLLVLLSVTLQFLNANIGKVIGITGAVMAFLVCFLYPILIHLRCLGGHRAVGLLGRSEVGLAGGEGGEDEVRDDEEGEEVRE